MIGALREQLEIGVNLSGPVDMDLRAQTRLAEAGLPLNVEVNSKQLYWPFTGEKQYQADDLKLKLTGKMTDYAISMRTAVKGQEIPPATITLDAKGNEQQVNLDKLTVAALEGKTEGKRATLLMDGATLSVPGAVFANTVLFHALAVETQWLD